ncbi:hypothetical protein HGRIS_001738 [Hohenbuehelia grisea]|uniref:Uncharacterized protein n=1 Tax=Hohenbuehelia grisea TaxID=104357 RepID=A0ABR3JIC6_9AGAR
MILESSRTQRYPAIPVGDSVQLQATGRRSPPASWTTHCDVSGIAPPGNNSRSVLRRPMFRRCPHAGSPSQGAPPPNSSNHGDFTDMCPSSDLSSLHDAQALCGS